MTAKSGHRSGTVSTESRVNSGDKGRATGLHPSAPVVQTQPRLLDLHSTAFYLGLSEWTVRDLEHAGLLPRVRIPLANNGELRKLLFDREDLDKAVERWKERTT